MRTSVVTIVGLVGLVACMLTLHAAHQWDVNRCQASGGRWESWSCVKGIPDEFLAKMAHDLANMAPAQKSE